MREEDKNFIIRQYFKVKALGWVKSNRKNNTGIGKTFEDYMGVVENNLKAPDLAGFEIKSHRDASQSYTTMFTKSPDFPRGANKFLRDSFGVQDEKDANLKKLHTSMFVTQFNTFKGKLSFRLINDRENHLFRIGVYDINDHSLINNDAGYYYSTIEKALKEKLKNLMYVSADRRFREDGTEEFFFNHADIYSEPSLDKFLSLIDNGQIMFDIRIGSYKSGKYYGKPHDHGSGFRILEPNIYLLYSNHEKVD